MDTISRDVILAWLSAFAEAISDNAAYLTDLDAAIGDADHGTNMNRGMQAVMAKLPSADGDIGAIFKLTAMTLISTVGGAAGPLYGTLFLQMSAVAKNDLTLAEWTAVLDAGVQGVQARGKAVAGDKTMLDALLPALHGLKAATTYGTPLAEALARSAKAAAAGRDATIPLLAKKGRASYLGERSIGHQDPGATSAHLLLQTLADILNP
jgi:phosphoenolpyruvate---glycerone phosphotransferase subunit DhaL